MKIKLIREVRIGLIVVLGILMIFLIVLGIKTYQTPIVKEEEKVKYEYSNEVKVNYDAYLKPNRLYTQTMLAEEPFYLSGFVKDIVVKFNMGFHSSVEAEVKGEYEIAVQLQGYEIEREEKHVIWTKEMEGEPKASFKKKDISHSIVKEISIPFETYNEFVTAVMEDAKANTEAEIVIRLMGKKSVTIDGKTKEIPIDTIVSIPLVKTYFGITKEGTEASKEVGKETIKIEIPPNMNHVIFYGVLAFISLLGIAGVVIVTIQPTLKDKYINRRKMLFQEHGSRMVAVDYIEEADSLEIYRVTTLDDLIKIADEIEKPVLYMHFNDILKINKFYVKDRNILYSYQVPEELLEEDSIEIKQNEDMGEGEEQVEKEIAVTNTK